MVLGALILCAVGIAFVVIGYLVWKKEMVTLFHDYHYDKVKEENKKTFCALSGAGLLVAGLGILLTAVLLALTDSVWSFLAFAAGFAIGMMLLLYAGRKYNR